MKQISVLETKPIPVERKHDIRQRENRAGSEYKVSQRVNARG